VQKEPFFHHDGEGFTFKIVEPQLLRVQVRFEDGERVSWNARLRDLFPKLY